MLLQKNVAKDYTKNEIFDIILFDDDDGYEDGDDETDEATAAQIAESGGVRVQHSAESTPPKQEQPDIRKFASAKSALSSKISEVLLRF